MNELRWEFDEDAEQQVLGAMLDNPGLVPTAIDILGTNPDAFYRRPHQLIYGAILGLFDEHGANIDQQLRKFSQIKGSPRVQKIAVSTVCKILRSRMSAKICTQINTMIKI